MDSNIDKTRLRNDLLRGQNIEKSMYEEAISLLLHERADLIRWRNMIDHELVICGIGIWEQFQDNPRKAIQALMKWEADLALYEANNSRMDK